MDKTYNIGFLQAFSELLSAMGVGVDFDISELPQSGSDRRYWRIVAGGRSFIGTYVPDAAEGECFVRLARRFLASGVAVPEIFAVSPDFHYYIQQDLGDTSLFSALGRDDCRELVMDTLLRLVAMQKTPLEAWHADCMCRDFSRRQVLWDLNYFKYEYLKPRNVIFDEDALEDDFERLAGRLASVSDRFKGFMMRDCQSRNVMLTGDGPVFIDFQGGRFGPVLYDAVSFLWQARAGFNPGFRDEMLDFYCDSFCNGDKVAKEAMLSSLNDIVLFRTLQVLGAYGFRGLVQHRSHFLLSIPGALANLRSLLDNGAVRQYQALGKACEKLVADPIGTSAAGNGSLQIDVFSFSYKKGYPDDLSGNGGGFMFDCRAMHNPGRYPEYRKLTGRDSAVIDFLERRGEVFAFLKNAWSLTDPAIERYLSRGFSHLQIGFGCTGGQHRSVYCAEHTAAHIRQLFPEAEVRLIHREHPAR